MDPLETGEHFEPGALQATVPGRLVVPDGACPTAVRWTVYDAEHVAHGDSGAVPDEPDAGVRWLDVTGFADAAVLTDVAKTTGLHPLALEDAVTGGQRPKAERYGDDWFVVVRLVKDHAPIRFEQVACHLHGRTVLTLQEEPGDCFGAVRARLDEGLGRLRSRGADYLLFALLDALVDHHTPVLEGLTDRLEDLEVVAFEGATRGFVPDLMALRRDLSRFVRVLRGTKVLASRLAEPELPSISEDNRPYFRDAADQLARQLDMAEALLDAGTNLLHAHLAVTGQRTNEVMQTLTPVATIFLPLSFIAGLYGMNFRSDLSPYNLPELSWRYGYLYALGLMVAVALGMVALFRRRRWIGDRADG